MTQTRFWTITLSNYTDESIRRWSTAVADGKADYICFQEETAPTTGTRHLQGYIVFDKVKRLNQVKTALGSPTLHAVRSNGTPSQNRDYCSKAESAIEGTFKEFGTIPDDPKRGKRSDFDEFKEAVENGLRCPKKARIDFPDLVAKYPRWCYDYVSDQQVLSVEDHPLYEWQTNLVQRLSDDPDDRKVIFVVDPVGNTGKTWFAKHYCKTHEEAQYMEPAKKADMAYALRSDLRVLFINITRTSDSKTHEYLYSFIESVKDGMVFSPKYESRMKYLPKCHVVVLMNMEPNYELLSSDRYEVIELK